MSGGQPYDHRAFLNAALRTDASPETLSALIVKLQLAANDINESLDHSSDALIAAVPKYGGRGWACVYMFIMSRPCPLALTNLSTYASPFLNVSPYEWASGRSKMWLSCNVNAKS
jgi:hypothetical protein